MCRFDAEYFKQLIAILLLSVCLTQRVHAEEVASPTPQPIETTAVNGGENQQIMESEPAELIGPVELIGEAESIAPLAPPKQVEPAPILAASELKLKDSQPTEKARYPTQSSYFEMAGGLFLVLIIFIGMAWAMRRFNLQMPGAQSNIKMLSALAVGPKEKVLLLEVEGEKLLIGVTTHTINALHQFKQPTNVPHDKSDDFAKQMESLLKQGSVHE